MTLEMDFKILGQPTQAHLELARLLQRPRAREEGLAAPLLLEVEGHAHHPAPKSGGGGQARAVRGQQGEGVRQEEGELVTPLLLEVEED